MLQDRITHQSAVHHRRQPLPVIPTLIIGVGKYGREVGRQLAIRLSITEAGLREKGLVRPLLAHVNERGETNFGLVRIMDLDWDRWFMHNLAPDYLLRDIEDAHPHMLDEETAPQVCEEERHPNDWYEARNALPHMREQLKLVAETLYMHNTPLQMGNYQTLGPDRNARLRVCVVCAAREADTSKLVPSLLELLGQLYVLQNTLTKGIQVICYVGSTSRPEHLRAGGDATAYDALKQLEVERILPRTHRPLTPGTPSPDSFLDSIADLWQRPGPSLISTCYLIDTGMVNNLTPVARRLDEPDETVVAAALTLNTFIASNDDTILSRASMPRWGGSMPYAEPGPFAAVGIASCSLDYPQLPHLIYGHMIGSFLRIIQPVTSNQQDGDIGREVDTRVKDLQDNIAWKEIRRTLPPLTVSANLSAQYRATIDAFLHADPSNRAQIKDQLERFSALPSLPSLQYDNLLQVLRTRQQLYLTALQEELSRHHHAFFTSGNAALTTLYRFVPQSLHALMKEAREVNAPLALTDMESQQRAFADQRSLLAQQALIQHISTVQHHLQQAPSRSGILGRSLLLAPLTVTALLLATGMTSAILLPLVFGSLAFSAVLYPGLSQLFRSLYWRSLTTPLQQIERQSRDILTQLDRTAWSWALAQAIAETEALSQRLQLLCGPNGLISETYDALLAEYVDVPERVLERIFFDEELRQELKIAAYNPAILWDERQRLLTTLVQHPWRNQQALEEWFLDETQQLYSKDWHTMLERIEQFLSNMSTEQFTPLWTNLTGAAVPFLKYTSAHPDSASIHKKMLSIHKAKQVPQLTQLAQRAGIDVLESTDRARWLFINTIHGLHVSDILSFDITS